MDTQKHKMLPRVIAVCGLKRSGKDTVADIIASEYGYNKIKISESLKDIIKMAFDMSDNQLESDLKDEIDDRWGVSPRKLMQFIGTEVMQYEIQKVIPSIGRNFWIKRLVETYIDKYPSERFVISDLRFPHEYEMLAKYKPCIMKVERKSITHECVHVSEQEFRNIPCDIVYKNDKSKEDLLLNVREFMNTFNQT
jgi:hypothetical protein|uniref:Deoxynucleoside monophosphate kinase n=1 Tax=viral metagenome TaxID=1070528 RepID=A0A6C0BH10_9ZZZZ